MLKHKSVTMAGNTGQILHYEGVLEKAGKRFFEGFRKRWFILDGKNLSYYKAAETTPENLLGIIDLTKVKAVVPFKMINNNAFQIITSMRTYTFTAATPLLMTEWISVLRQAMQIEIFANKRANNSVRQSSTKDDAGYEVVSRTSSSASEQATNEDVLYDQVHSKEDASQGSYESVGSFKRTASSSVGQQLDDYDTVTPLVKSPPPSNVPQIGTYGVIGVPGPQSPKVPDVYATVQKKRSSAPEEIPMETEDAMYAEVGNVETKQSKLPEINVMAIICESDDDDDEEEEENDDAFLEESLQDLITDPLPPPKGDSYAVEQIKLLLKDFKKDDSYKLNRENSEEITESTSVPESCEKAFTNLRDFLNQLESN